MIKTYSLDTCTCIDVIRNKNVKARHQFAKAIRSGHEIVISSIVLHELSYGASKSQNPPRNLSALQVFLTGVRTLDFDADDAMLAGQVRYDLAARGTSIGPYDTLIATQALRRNLTLVTANFREFSRVTGLSLVSWSQ